MHFSDVPQDTPFRIALFSILGSIIWSEAVYVKRGDGNIYEYGGSPEPLEIDWRRNLEVLVESS